MTRSRFSRPMSSHCATRLSHPISSSEGIQMKTMTAPELAAWLADGTTAQPVLLDVREPWEFQTCHIDGAVLMPMNTVPTRMVDLDEDAAIFCICHHGARSMQV